MYLTSEYCSNHHPPPLPPPAGDLLPTQPQNTHTDKVQNDRYNAGLLLFLGCNLSACCATCRQANTVDPNNDLSYLTTETPHASH